MPRHSGTGTVMYAKDMSEAQGSTAVAFKGSSKKCLASILPELLSSRMF